MDPKALSSGIQYPKLPESYVRPESELPKLPEVSEWENVPVIDLACDERSLIVRQIGDACKSYGCFQELISDSLGLDKDYIKNMVSERGLHMDVKFYLPCPGPELSYDLPGQTDPNALTILLQDFQVVGLQVLKDGKWVAVKPHPNAFVVNIGDQLQAVSKGRYKSVAHRAIANAAKERMLASSIWRGNINAS